MAEWEPLSIKLGEWLPDQSAYYDPQKEQGTGVRLAQNAIYLWDNWKEVRGRHVIGSQVVPAGVGFPISAYCDFYGTIYIGTFESRIYGFKETTYGSAGSWSDYSAGGLAYQPILTPTIDQPGSVVPGWSFTIFGPNVIAAQGQSQGHAASPMQFRPMNTGTTFSQLVGGADRPTWAYIGTTKSFLIGANLQAGGQGAYATPNAQEYGWSAINDPTTWTPDTTGTTQCGFAFVADEDGAQITGLACFAEYFLIFKENSIIRCTYAGGALVWDAQVVASGAFGLPANAWGASIVRCGRDVYYFSKCGPAVVINGEYVQRVGEGKFNRYVSDQLRASGALETGYAVRGAYLPEYHQVAWVMGNSTLGNDANGQALSQLLVYDIASYRLTSYQRGDDPGHACQVLPPLAAVSICAQRAFTSESTLDRLRLIEFDPTGHNLVISGLTDPATSLPLTLRSQIWHPSPDAQFRLQKARLLWLLDATTHSPAGAVTYPIASILVEWSNDPQMRAGMTSSKTVTTAGLDTNGFINDDLFPLLAGFFRFTVTIPSMSNQQTLRQCSELEIIGEEQAMAA